MADLSRELGHPAGVGVDMTDWSRATSYVSQPIDPNFALRFPQSVQVWDTMRRTDSQVGSILRAITLPIKRARWQLAGDDVRPEIIDFVRTELGLGELEGRRRRRRHGVVWHEHLRDALLMLPLGFMAFEQVYLPEMGGEAADRLGLGAVLHLRKLAPRMPSTIVKISVERDGGLKSITQTANLDAWSPQVMLDGGTVIPVERLVMYVNDREGADWSGTSLLRSAYGDWYIKNQLTRINAQSVERNGMGVPKITVTDESQRSEAEKIAREFRAGASAGLVLPSSMNAELMGVSGSTRDAIPSIQYHDQQIAKSVLAMFLDLGHDNGARSLGETFADVFTDSLQAVADSIAETATEHVIRDLVELNMGPDEPYPVLTAGDLSANARLSADALVKLVSGGVVTSDDSLEDYVRKTRGLPERDPATARAQPTTTQQQAPAAPVPAPTAESLLPAGLSEGDHLTQARALLEQVRRLRQQD